MTQDRDLRGSALTYHQRLPERLWDYLRNRGIPDPLIHSHLLGWNGQRITIPVPDPNGRISFFKFAKDPEDRTDSPKMLSTLGAKAELYGWEWLRARPNRVIVCEGEFDRLVLESHGFAAVTSTGGASVFRTEWADEFKLIPDVFLCFDRDEAGRGGALRVARLIPHAKVVELPEEVGRGGDVTDFFIRLGRSREDFLRLLEKAQPAPPEAETAKANKIPPRRTAARQVEELKAIIRLEDLVGRYMPLRRSGQNYSARCPFHEDHTPSFIVYPPSQSFYCFGCQAHGDVLTFLMRIEHLSFPEARKVLQELAP